MTVQAPMGRSAAAEPAATWRTVFAPQNCRRLIVGASINVGIMSAIFGFVSWIPTFFASEGKDITSSVLFAAIMSIGSPLGVFLGLLVTERLERRWGIVTFSLLAALLGVGYVFADTASAIVAMGFLVVTVIYLTGTLGMTGYVPELFPTDHRMRSVGVCTTVGRMAGIALPFAVVPVFSAFGQRGVVTMVALILIAQAAIVAWLGLGTNGRPLESI
jgi:putative MFS transporter